MPRRCRYEEAKPGGCRKGSSCDFLHPGASGWDAPSEGFGRGSRSSFSSNRAKDGQNVSKSASEWDKSSWGPSASNTVKLPDSTNRWGAPSQPEVPSPKVNEGFKSTWDSGTNFDNEQGGSAWGDSSGTGWGTEAPTWGSGVNSASAWGSLLGENKTDAKESDGDAWGTGGSISAWGGNPQETSFQDPADNSQKSGGKGKQKEDFKEQDPSPPLDAWSTKWSARPPDASLAPAPPPPDQPSRKSSSSHLNPNAHAPAHGLTLQSPVITSPTIRPPASSSVLQPGFSLGADLKKEALGLLDTWRTHEGGKALSLDSDIKSSTPTTSKPTKRYIGPTGRVALFSDIVRYMQGVVVCQVLLLRAQEEEDRWKRTQASHEYERASFRARQMLYAHRTTYSDKVKNAKKQLQKALERLVDLPDFATPTQTVGPGLTKEALTTYTTEFKEWVQDLELHRRVRLERAATPPKPPTAQELFQRGHWTFRELNEAIVQLEERLNNTSEEIYAEVYTKFDDFSLEDDLIPIPPDGPLMDFGPQMDDLAVDTSDVLTSLLEQAPRAMELREKVDRLEKEIALIMQEKASMNQLVEQAELQLSEYQQFLAAEESEIRMITQQIQTLYLHNPVAPTPNTTLEPVQINDLLDHIRPIVTGQLEKDIAPILATLRQRCLENQNGLTDEIDEMVKPVLAMTDEILQRTQPPSPKTGPHSQ